MPDFKKEADAAGAYPDRRFGQRERKLLDSVQNAYPFACIAAGSFTTVGGDADEAILVSGCLASDIAMVVLKSPGAIPRTILSSAAALGQINVVFSGDPDDDHVVSYLLFRAQ